MTIPDLDQIHRVLEERFVAREKAITGSRRVIRNSANGIRALHREEWDNADSLIAEAERELALIATAIADHPELGAAGFVADACKEFAEASLTRAVFRGETIPSFLDLEIDPVPFLHGLGETVGEMRRRLLDLLRAEELERAESLLVKMDDFVDLLAEIDYPDGMTAGLRRTTDISRSLVERSRADLTATVVQERLRRDLEAR